MADLQALSSDQLQTVSFLRKRSQLQPEESGQASAHSVIWQRLACLVGQHAVHLQYTACHLSMETHSENILSVSSVQHAAPYVNASPCLAGG